MNETSIRIVRRVATYMLETAEQSVDLHFFQGLGLTLAVCYEEMTGQTATNKKPKDLIQWALALPAIPYPKVVS